MRKTLKEEDMSQPGHVIALDLHEPKTLDEDIAVYYEKCQVKLGFVPNVIRAYAWNQKKLRNFIAFYNELMLGDSGLSRLEREMIAVVVSPATAAITAKSHMARRCANIPKTPCWAN